MAACIAGAVRADKLVLLTDVEGVRGRDNVIHSTITPAESRFLIGNGIATGGMQAKLEAAAAALYLGVGEITIAPGAGYGVISLALSSNEARPKRIAAVEVSDHGSRT